MTYGKLVTFNNGGSGSSSSGDVVGPASATDNGFARFDGTTGKLIKNSPATITNTDVIAAAGIAYSKLNLTGSVVNADIGAAAGIVYSKLNLTGGIVNADVGAAAAIAFSKLATLTSANILVGSAGNVATAVAVSGDISLSNAGATAYSGTVPLNKGGTGQTTKAPAFDALSPMSAGGDLIYGGASGTGTRLANGSAGQVLTSAGTTAAPTWSSVKIQSYELSNLGLSASIASNILTIALKQADGSTNPSATNPVVIGFRDATATNGDFSSVSVTGALSLAVGTAVSLGGKTAISYYIYIYALNNAGTAELFASLHPFWDEGIVQSTSTTGTSNAVLYGANARSNMAVRLIGRVKATWTNAVGWSSITNVDLLPFNKPAINIFYYDSSTTVSGTGAKITYTTPYVSQLIGDPYNCYASGTFTAPIAGVYSVQASIATVGAAVLGNASSLYVVIDATTSIFKHTQFAWSTLSLGWDNHISGTVRLTAGQTIQVFALTDQATPSISSDDDRTFVSIVMVGP